MSADRPRWAHLWNQASCVSRSDIFTQPNKLLPESQQGDVETPAVGFLGSAYDITIPFDDSGERSTAAMRSRPSRK